MWQAVRTLHPAAQQQRRLSSGRPAVGMNFIQQDQRRPLTFPHAKQMVAPAGVHLKVEHFRGGKQNIWPVAFGLLGTASEQDLAVIQLMMALGTGQHFMKREDIIASPFQCATALLLRVLRMRLLAFH